MPALAQQAGLPMRLRLPIAAVCLLLQGVLQAAGQVQVSGVTGDASVRYTWSQPTLTVTPDAVNINRGDQVVLTFEGAATATQETNSVTIKGTASVSGSNGTGPCDVSSTTGELVQLRVTVDGQSVFVPAARQGQLSPRCVQPAEGACSNIPFTMTLTTTTTQPTTVTVSAFWNPAAGGAPIEVAGCQAAEGTITYVNPSKAVGETATITQKLDYPDWKGMTISNWLTQEPSASAASAVGTMPTVVTTTGSSNGVTVRASDGWSARWTVTISSIQFCLNQPQPVTNIVTLTPEGGGGAQQSPTVSVPLQVKGCDQPIGISFNNPFLQTQATYSWTHSIQATGATSVLVDWGASATVPARAVFQRTVTNAVFLLTGEMQLTNPENAPVWVQALQIQCPWTSTIVISCGVATFGTGVGFVIPARGTLNCPVNQQVPGIWGADMTQPCRVYAQNYWSIETIQSNIVLNFMAPRQWVRINDCVQWTMFCSSPTGGSRNWLARVTGGPTGGGLRVCGNDNNAPIPDQDASIAIGGTWNGNGDQPGDCGNAMSATCTSQLLMQNTGATTQSTSGGGTSAQIAVTATPQNCPTPRSPDAPVPFPSPDPLGFSGVNRMMPGVTIRVTKTRIQGTFGWDVSATVEPATQTIVMGSTGTAKYTVIATRGDADEGPPVKYIIEGEITLKNTYDKILPISGVNVLLGTAKVPATCSYPSAGLDPRSTVTCTFALLYSLGPAPGSLDAEVALPDTPTRATADAQASFGFASADISAARGLCASVNMSFAANEGMGLIKNSDVGATPLRVDGQGVRVCGTTQFGFVVAYNPNLPLSCGSQLVLGTAMVIEEDASTAPPHSAVAIATVTATCGGLLDNNGNGGGSNPGPTPPSSGGSSSDGGVTVTLGDVGSQPVENVVWRLSLSPNGLTGNKVTKPADGSVDLKFDLVHTRSVETMTGYSGDVSIINGGSTPLKVDSVTIELIDQMSGDSNTVAQIAGKCSNGEVSSSNLLEIAAGATATCSFELRAKLGGQVIATITAVDVPDAVQSQGKSVQSLMSNGVTEGCAQLVTGLGASTLVPDGRLLAGGTELLSSEVCQTGRTQVLYSIGSTEAPCGTYPFLAAAAITQSADTTAPVVTAAAAVDIEVTGCSGTPPAAASLSLVRSYKTRLMQWSVTKQTAVPIDGAFTYVPGGDNTVNVTVLFSRQLKAGQQVAVAGTGTVNTESQTPVFGRSRMVLMPLCTAGACLPIQVTPSCNATVTDGAFSCKFQADKLPVAPGIVLPLMYAAADQAWPHTAKAVVYDPSNSSGRRTLGRCAMLTDTVSITGGPFDKPPATVLKQNEVNPLPTTAVCASSFLFSYDAQLSGVECGGATVDYTFNSQAKAAPSDMAGGVAAASLDFTVTC